jgi:CO dehydrogenase maturation factor
MTPARPSAAEVIAVTGKGGVGKSTVAAMIIRHLKQSDTGAILALDADPDANLATLLGVDVETTIGDLREDVLRQIRDFPAGMSKDTYVQTQLHQIIVETPKVDLITMGRGEGPGCYCFINHVLREFADGLTPSYRWMVMDNEAGMEHLSRRTAGRIDHLMVVVNESPLSIDSARRIDRLAGEIGRDIRNRYLLLNAVRPQRVEAVRQKMTDLGLAYLGAIPRDETIEEAVFRGESIYALEDSPAVEIMGQIMHQIGVG